MNMQGYGAIVDPLNAEQEFKRCLHGPDVYSYQCFELYVASSLSLATNTLSRTTCRLYPYYVWTTLQRHMDFQSSSTQLGEKMRPFRFNTQMQASFEMKVWSTLGNELGLHVILYSMLPVLNKSYVLVQNIWNGLYRLGKQDDLAMSPSHFLHGQSND